MAQHELDVATFRLLFPAFANPQQFPEAYISAQWDMATSYIAPWDNCFISGKHLQNALNLLTAHLMQLNVNMGQGGGSSSGGAGGSGDSCGAVVGVVTGATIDKVSVQMAAPTTRNGWQYWLASTPYGMQLWALLKALSAGGFYIGGRPERAGFRKIGGRF